MTSFKCRGHAGQSFNTSRSMYNSRSVRLGSKSLMSTYDVGILALSVKEFNVAWLPGATAAPSRAWRTGDNSEMHKHLGSGCPLFQVIFTLSSRATTSGHCCLVIANHTGSNQLWPTSLVEQCETGLQFDLRDVTTAQTSVQQHAWQHPEELPSSSVAPRPAAVASFNANLGRQVSHDSPRTPNVHIWGSRRFKHHQNSLRRPQRNGKRAKFLALHLLAPPFGPNFF